MSRRPGRNHQPAFKAKVALEAAKEEVTTVELSQNMTFTPIRSISRSQSFWSLRPRYSMTKSPVSHQAKIGQLALENDFVESALAKAGMLSAMQ